MAVVDCTTAAGTLAAGCTMMAAGMLVAGCTMTAAGTLAAGCTMTAAGTLAAGCTMTAPGTLAAGCMMTAGYRTGCMMAGTDSSTGFGHSNRNYKTAYTGLNSIACCTVVPHMG